MASAVFGNFFSKSSREADELSTDTEAGTLASSHADSGGKEIEHDEDGGREEGEGADLTHRELGLGDEEGGHSDSETLDEVLNDTGDELRDKGVHLYILS